MGRSVANEGFIRAFLRRDPFTAYHFYLPDQRQTDILHTRLSQEFPDMQADKRIVISTFARLPEALATHDFHCFHLSDCLLHNAPLAALRNRYARTIFPVTGCTHTISYARYLPMFLGHLWPGCSARDAVIATSTPAVDVVQGMYAHLREAYAMPAMPSPQVAQIPLGIALEDFPLPDAARRDAARTAMGIAENDIVLLTLGRISHHSKMDVLPLLRALRRLLDSGLESRCGGAVRLVLAGGMQSGDEMAAVLVRLAASNGVRLLVVPNPTDAQRTDLYSAADIFVSPVDNMQETFGLTILEAGSMGLPVVASDYDGYRDLVWHEETGFLVPTLGPAEAQRVNAMAPLVYDTATHLAMGQRTVVDVPALAGALERLADSAELRRTMGQKALHHVREHYGWDTVVTRYLELWERLNDSPVDEAALRASRHPMEPRYAEVFGGYPATVLHDSLQVVWSRSGEAVYRGKEQPVVYEGIADAISLDLLKFMLFSARKPLAVGTLTAVVTAHAAQGASLILPDVELLLLWALKHDLLERV